MTGRTLGLPLDRERPLAPQVREARPGELAIAILASLVGGCTLVATGDGVAFGLLGVSFFLVLGALRPALFLTLVVAVRPLLDQWGSVTIGVRSANVAAALALGLIVAATLDAARRRRVRWPLAATAMALALAVTAVSAVQALVTIGPPIGAEPVAEVLRFASLLATYVLAANVFASPEQARRLFVVVGLSGVAPAVWGVIEWINGPPIAPDIGLPRISGPFVGPIPLGAFLAFAGLVLLFGTRDRLRPSVRLLALIPICGALVGSLSREGWVTFLGGALVLGRRVRKSVVVIVAVVVIGLLLLVPTVRERALPASAPAGAPVEQTYASWTWRTKNWETLLGEWRRQPVFGYGLRSTVWVNPRTPVTSQGQPGGGFDAHSLVVRLLVEGGVVMFAVYAGFFALLIRSAWRMARDPWELQPLGRLLLVIWTLMLLVGITTDDPLDGTAVMIPLLALTGSLDAAHRTSARAPTVR
jgi:O-antigen ligase